MNKSQLKLHSYCRLAKGGCLAGAPERMQKGMDSLNSNDAQAGINIAIHLEQEHSYCTVSGADTYDFKYSTKKYQSV